MTSHLVWQNDLYQITFDGTAQVTEILVYPDNLGRCPSSVDYHNLPNALKERIETKMKKELTKNEST